MIAQIYDPVRCNNYDVVLKYLICTLISLFIFFCFQSRFCSMLLCRSMLAPLPPWVRGSLSPTNNILS